MDSQKNNTTKGDSASNVCKERVYSRHSYWGHECGRKATRREPDMRVKFDWQTGEIITEPNGVHVWDDDLGQGTVVLYDRPFCGVHSPAAIAARQVKRDREAWERAQRVKVMLAQRAEPISAAIDRFARLASEAGDGVASDEDREMVALLRRSVAAAVR